MSKHRPFRIFRPLCHPLCHPPELQSPVSLRRILLLLLLVSVLISAGASASSAAEATAPGAPEAAVLHLDAPPAPNPPAPVFSPVESASEAQRLVVLHDLRTGRVDVSPRASRDLAEQDDAGFLGTGISALSEWDVPSADAFPSSESIIPTAPTPWLNTTTYPFATIYKMVMRFEVGGVDNYYTCSAFAASEFHLVTAGHCVYNWDPDDNGNTSDRKFADDIWVWAGQTDRVAPFSPVGKAADWPYGWAKVTRQRAYSGWVNDQNYDHDFAVVTLDRRVGTRTGWMARSSVVPSSLNFSGYPTELPHVPASTLVQYYGFDSGNVVDVTDYRIELDALIYGGHSGGPSWKFVNGIRYAVGIHSTSDRAGTAFDTLLTSTKRASINSFIATDESEVPPAASSDLVESLFDGQPHKGVNRTSVGHLDTIVFDFEIVNAGFAATANEISIAYYASSNQYVTPVDHLLAIDLIPGIATPWASRAYSETVTIPQNLPAGTYYLGWFMGDANEYQGDILCESAPCSNLVSIAGQAVTIEDCTVDAQEPDDSAPEAIDLVSGAAPQEHSICSSGDEDWTTFTLAVPSAIVLRTSGSLGDTELLLYNQTLNQLIEWDDDGGGGLFSRIDRSCGGEELPAGTYYVKTVGDGYVADYGLELTATPCDSDPIFVDGFESGDAGAWSLTVP